MDSEQNQTHQEQIISYGTDLDAIGNINRYKVLLVEDDPDSILLLKRVLIIAGYDVCSANNGVEGLKKVEQVHPDIALLDMMMPDMNGWEMLEQLRKISNMPVIVITALGKGENAVNALKMGADDYITKPFNNAEVIERIRVILRRVTKLPEHNVNFEKVGLSVDLKNGEVWYHKQVVELTNKEFAIMASLVRHAPAAVNYEVLRQEVWGEDQPAFQNRVKYLVFSLRQKLAAIDPKTELITTVGRHGYRLQVD
jgi:DNA-binding response OmpR family regulator